MSVAIGFAPFFPDNVLISHCINKPYEESKLCSAVRNLDGSYCLTETPRSRSDSVLGKCCRAGKVMMAPNGFILAMAHAVWHWILRPSSVGRATIREVCGHGHPNLSQPRMQAVNSCLISCLTFKTICLQLSANWLGSLAQMSLPCVSSLLPKPF